MKKEKKTRGCIKKQGKTIKKKGKQKKSFHFVLGYFHSS